MSFVGLVPSERSSGERRRQGSITKAGNVHLRPAPCRGCVERSAPATGRLHARSPPARPGRDRDHPRLALPAAALPALAQNERPRQAHPEDRRRLRSRARRLRLGDRLPPTPARGGLNDESLRPEQRSAPHPKEDPGSIYAAPTPVGDRDARASQLPTVPSHAVPTRECQSDPPSLSRAVRCSRPQGQPPSRGPPLDFLLHVS